MKIGLMGPFGFGNLGDAATQDAILQHLRKRVPHAELVGYSLNPEDTASRHGIESHAISRQSWKDDELKPIAKRITAFAAWLGARPIPGARTLQRWLSRLPIEHALIADARRNLQGVSMLVLSGGGQVEDYWGGGGPWSYPYTLLKWCLLAKLGGAKIAMVSVGAGPIRYGLSKFFLRRALALTDYRSFRDEFSQRLARSVGVASDNGVFPDLAFSLDLPATKSERDASAGRRIAVGPIGFMRPDYWPDEDAAQYEVYAQKIVAFVRYLIDRGDTVVFVPGEASFDQDIIGDIIERLDADEYTAKRLLRPRIETVTELVDALASVDTVVASRFHNLVLAHMLGKPTIALSYQEKIDSLMKAAELDAYCSRVSLFDVATLKRQLASIEAEGPEIRERLLRQCATYRSELDRQYEVLLALARED